MEHKLIAQKQIAHGLYPPAAYVMAATLVQFPTAFFETASYSAILYNMVGLVPSFGRWVRSPPARRAAFSHPPSVVRRRQCFFFLVLWLVNVSVGSLFRAIAYLVPTFEAAQTAPGPFIAMQVIFAGFLIPPNHMGTKVSGTPWLIWLYYISVFAYALRSLAQNEFLSPKYHLHQLDPAFPPASVPAGGTHITDFASQRTTLYFSPRLCARTPGLCLQTTLGQNSMDVLKISSAPGWKWAGVGFIIGFGLLANVAGSWALGRSNFSRTLGTSRIKDEEEPSVNGGGGGDKAAAAAPTPPSVSVPVTPPGGVASVMPFTPSTVAWRELRYTVQSRSSGPKALLQGVSGAAVPGRLLALMGASGAGKSTLLDVIAGRKTAGRMEGQIFLNGHPREQRSFARLTAYCEQQDIHNSFSTVREALCFSAKLRLPRGGAGGVDDATAVAFVDETVDLLELRPLSGRLVGELGTPNALAPGQRKVLTIAVELVSNAPILFLDEPTSGLDARAAAVVMRVVARIASTGRTVITTVHQPSAEIFAMFDDLLLMQRGGFMAFLGPVGDLVPYLEAIPGVHRLPRAMNPASWMLDVLAGSDSSGGGGAEEQVHLSGEALGGAVLQQQLLDSPAWTKAQERIEAASTPAPGSAPVRFDSVCARSFPAQLRIVLGRTMTSLSRNVGYVWTKITVLLGLNIFFGIIWLQKLQEVTCAPGHSCGNDVGGVNAVVSVLFLSTLFLAIVSLNTSLPVLFRERAVFYRELYSKMYAPEAHALSFALAEIPWLVICVLICITPLYFMVGFPALAGRYFFYILVVALLAYSFVSLGQLAAALFPTAEVAQAVVGLIIPLAFLFGGLYLQKPLIPNGASNGHPGIYWRWAYYLDPISYSLEALVPGMFVDQTTPSSSNHTIVTSAGHSVNSYAYVSRLYDVRARAATRPPRADLWRR